MNLNGSAILIKKRAQDPDLKSDLTELMLKTEKPMQDREARIERKKYLCEEVKKIKKKSVDDLENVVFDAAKKIRNKGDVLIAKKPIDVAEYIRGIVGREKLAIVPSPQTMEAEVMQAFFMSNKVDVASDKYADQEKGLASIHPYIPYPQGEAKAKKSDANYAIISAIVLTENGNIYVEKEELEALKKYKNVFVIVSADRIFSEIDADKVAHLMDISSGGFIRSEKTDLKGHLIILDNGRLALARSELKDILMCVNCYSCSLYCPIYYTVGGLFGSPMMAGIGAISVSYQSGIKTGVNRGLYYCTLCKKCDLECPTDVPIVDLIRKMRKRAQVSGL